MYLTCLSPSAPPVVVQRLLLRVSLEAIALEMLSHRRLVGFNAPGDIGLERSTGAAYSPATAANPSWSAHVARLVSALEVTENGNNKYLADTLRRYASGTLLLRSVICSRVRPFCLQPPASVGCADYGAAEAADVCTG